MTDSQTVPGDPTWTDLLVPSREVPLGGLRGIQVNRTLPHRAPPTVGAWCFVDCFGPTGRPMQVLPHPHTGVQAVTLPLPLRGHIHHKDSLGNDAVLKPGEVNLMTAGDKVAHSEFSLGEGPLHGVQLWVALPDERRTGAADFEHHVDLPVVGSPNLTTMVFMGELAAVTSPVTTYTPLVGADLELCAGKATLGLNRNFEHAIMVLEGQAKLNSLRLPAAQAVSAPRTRMDQPVGRSGYEAVASRWGAVRRGTGHVVEFHRPHARRDRGCSRGLGSRVRTVRPGRWP